MTNKEVIKVLKELKTYCAAPSLDAVHYAIAVFERLEKAGVSDPINADYSRLAK